jgi:hypothetical protein
VTPLFACLPVCLTFVALGIVGLIVVVTGAYHALDLPAPADGTEPPGPKPGEFAPPWWLFVLLPAAVILLTLLTLWLAPEW